MTDQQVLISDVRKEGSIIAEHLEPRGRDAVRTLSRLIEALDNETCGLRVVK
jgi:hypothetical protein